MSTVDVMLPVGNDWIPYTQARIAVGKIFAQARGDRQENSTNLM